MGFGAGKGGGFASTVFADVTNQLFSALGQAAASPVNQGYRRGGRSCLAQYI